jgi:hypothetical protein
VIILPSGLNRQNKHHIYSCKQLRNGFPLKHVVAEAFITRDTGTLSIHALVEPEIGQIRLSDQRPCLAEEINLSWLEKPFYNINVLFSARQDTWSAIIGLSVVSRKAAPWGWTQ